MNTAADMHLVLELAAKKAERRRFDPEPVSAFAHLDTSCTARVGRSTRKCKTPGEACAVEMGYADYPNFIGPDSASYRQGWFDAEKDQQRRDEARAERAAEKWAE